MRLNLATLRIEQNGPGTPATRGTLGTANNYPPSCCSRSEGVVGTAGTRPCEPGEPVPTVPTGGTTWEQEAVIVSAPVPAVPGEKGTCLQDHTLSSDNFSRWALASCLFRDRCSGEVKVMHLHFCDWCSARQTVECVLEIFEELLADEGFRVAGGLVYGLILKEGLETELFEPAGAETSGKADALRVRQLLRKRI